MPTYDYQCQACDHSFELFQQMTAAVKRKCPACGKLKLQRLIGTGSGVIFKGGGFYQTDYRSESYKKAAEADSKPSSDSDKKSKTETTKDTSSASKSESSSSPSKPKAKDTKSA